MPSSASDRAALPSGCRRRSLRWTVASRISYDAESSRCCAPSCRSRSRRRRSWSPASTIRAPGGAELLELGERLGLQPLVVERQRERRAHRGLDLGYAAGVGHHGDELVIADQCRERAAGLRGRCRPSHVPTDRRTSPSRAASRGSAASGRPTARPSAASNGPGGGASPMTDAIRETARCWRRVRSKPHTSAGGEEDHRRAVDDEDLAEHRVRRIFQRAAHQGQRTGRHRRRDDDGRRRDRQQSARGPEAMRSRAARCTAPPW